MKKEKAIKVIIEENVVICCPILVAIKTTHSFSSSLLCYGTNKSASRTFTESPRVKSSSLVQSTKVFVVKCNHLALKPKSVSNEMATVKPM